MTDTCTVIRKYAGKDATGIYSSVHPPSLLTHQLDADKMMGKLDPKTPKDWWKEKKANSEERLPENGTTSSAAVETASSADLPPSAPTALAPSVPETQTKPPLHTLISYHDFETVAQKCLTPKTWAFYSSAATDTLTHQANNSVYSRILLRPRIMRDVRTVSTSATILDQPATLPLFVAPAALARMAHPDGECAIARACAKAGIPQCISTNASYPVNDIVAAGKSVVRNERPVYGRKELGNRIDPTFFFQLYVDKDRSKSEALLKNVEELGFKGIFVTVDAAVPGKREADEKVGFATSISETEAVTSPMTGEVGHSASKGGGIARTMGGFIDSSLNWKDVEWLRKSTKLPLVLKGVMHWADAVKAARMGLDGVLLSNHGGRNLDTSPPSLLTLLELQQNAPWLFEKLEVYVDGGIKRGTDIFKALCLGATAVSVGRGVLYSVHYGEEGTSHFVEVLRDEFETTMRLCGVTSLEELGPHLVSTADIDHLVTKGMEHPWIKGRAKSRL